MTREEAKELLPIIKAFAEGKIVQIKDKTGKWNDLYEPCWNYSPDKYRIKPEPKYRPFKNQEECWEEMLKHQPFGWIRSINNQRLCNIDSIGRNTYGIYINNSIMYFDATFNTHNFADGTPFGIKDE